MTSNEEARSRGGGHGAAFRLRNLTPHRTLTYLGSAEPVVLGSEGVARCAEITAASGWWDEGHVLPRVVVSYGAVTGLPDPEPGVIYVVSQLVVAQLPERDDLAFPFGLVRDDKGDIIGFSALATLALGDMT